MAENGRENRGRGVGRRGESDQTLEERLQQLISSRLQTVMSSVLTQVNERNDEVKAMLEKLNDRIIGLEDLVKTRGDTQSETSNELLCSPTKKSKLGSSSDGIVIFRVQNSIERTCSAMLPFKSRSHVLSPQ